MKIDSIYRLFTGDYIDFSKIVHVSDICAQAFGDEIWFDIHFQLAPTAIRIKIFRSKRNDFEQSCAEEENIRKQYDYFINDWKEYKKQAESK